MEATMEERHEDERSEPHREGLRSSPAWGGEGLVSRLRATQDAMTQNKLRLQHTCLQHRALLRQLEGNAQLESRVMREARVEAEEVLRCQITAQLEKIRGSLLLLGTHRMGSAARREAAGERAGAVAGQLVATIEEASQTRHDRGAKVPYETPRPNVLTCGLT